MEFKHLVLSLAGFGKQTLHHKDAVIHADTVNEGGDNNIDQIEFQAEEGHVSLHHIPAHEHREEGHQGYPDVAEAE